MKKVYENFTVLLCGFFVNITNNKNYLFAQLKDKVFYAGKINNRNAV